MNSRLFFSLCTCMALFLGCEESDIEQSLNTEPSNSNNGVINDEINGVPIVVYSNSKRSFFSAFKRVDHNGIEYTFENSGYSFPDALKDKNGDIWDAFGNLKNGSTKIQLQRIENLVGYWFVFPPFHKTISLYDGSVIANPEIDNSNAEDWLVDRNFVFAGSIKDGIQSIDSPVFISATSKQFIDDEFYNTLDPDELITVIQVENEVHLYPHRILEYHEVVNDMIGNQPIAVSFCPLTGTSRAWYRTVNGQIFEFGVSGLLYNNNLIMYDRQTDSNWSQIFGFSINGVQKGESISSIDVWEIKVEDILSVSGRIRLLSTDTGINYDYQHSVYGDYKYSDRISFPLTFSDDRIPPKERVIGVTVGDSTKVYRISDFQ